MTTALPISMRAAPGTPKAMRLMWSMTAQKATTTKNASSPTATYWPLARPAFRMASSLTKIAKGGAPAMANPPATRASAASGDERIRPRTLAMSWVPTAITVMPAAKKQKDLAMAWPVIW